MRQSWEAGAKAFEDTSITREDITVEKQVSGIKLSTFGIPPDYVLFRVTNRMNCEEMDPPRLQSESSSTAQTTSKKQRGKTILDFHDLQLDPDLSQTPFYLGSLGTSRGDYSSPFLIENGKLYANFIGEVPVEIALAKWLNTNFQTVTKVWMSS